MKTPIWIWVQRLLPQRLLCAFIYWISRTEAAWIKSPLIRWFAKHYRIDMSEAMSESLADYASFNAFFTRALKPNARTIDQAPGIIVSPADGRITEFGAISAGQLLQAKGFSYSADELLGISGETALSVHDGAYATIYLAPHNYHRIHAATAGRITHMRYIAGARYSVNAMTAAHIPGLFCRNERLVCWFDSAVGPYALVLVGALNVSSIATTSTGEIKSGRDKIWHDLRDASLERGEEFATFNLGSTVILLFPQQRIAWRPELDAGDEILLGHVIARASVQ